MLRVERGGGCTWAEGVSRAEGEPGVEEDLALLGLQVDRGAPSLPPTPEEGGEGGMHFRLVGVLHGEVGGEGGRGHAGAKAAPSGPILALVGDLKRPHGRFQDGGEVVLTAHSSIVLPWHLLKKNLNECKIPDQAKT